MAMEEEKREGQPSSGFAEPNRQIGFVDACKQQWQRTVDHMHAYPYVWASYIVVYGGLGIYGAWTWRKLRRAEDELMRLQRELVKMVQEDATSQAVRESQESVLPLQQHQLKTPPPNLPQMQQETPLKV